VSDSRASTEDSLALVLARVVEVDSSVRNVLTRNITRKKRSVALRRNTQRRRVATRQNFTDYVRMCNVVAFHCIALLKRWFPPVLDHRTTHTRVA
jgi:hypothetical protein